MNSCKLKTLNTQDLFFFFKGWEVGELRSRLDAHGEALAAVRSTVLQGRAATTTAMHRPCFDFAAIVSTPT